MRQFIDAKKNKTLVRMVNYLVEENFPNEHLEALFKIIRWFNWSEDSERDVFEFSKKLHKRHNIKGYLNGKI